MHSTLNTTRLALRTSLRHFTPPTRTPPLRRAFSAQSASQATTSGPAAVQQALAALTTELDRLAPRFEVRAGDVRIIKTPAEFYATLKEKIGGARERVFLATLYIGKEEDELIETLRGALVRNPKLKVEILTDALRGTREQPEKCSASMLAPLVKQFGERVEVRMYHTPGLTGLAKKYVPPRFNEGWGLQHMKIYGVDDEVILSGANLSNDYFTNRQDRYHLFSSPQLANYYHTIFQTISSLSFLVLPTSSPAGFTLTWPGTNPGPSPLISPKEFKQAATFALAPLLRPARQPVEADLSRTWVYPLGQFTPVSDPIDISTEHAGVSAVLSTLSSPELSGSNWTFTAGYFNIHPSLKKLLLASQSESGTVITASPEANGFYGSKGVSGHLPGGYTLLSRRFLKTVLEQGKKDVFHLKEWKLGTVGHPGGWTYHAKGLWIGLPGDKAGPAISMVGSSNFTKRSYALDLEMGALVVTGEEKLKKELKSEVENLEMHTKKVGIEDFDKVDRQVGVVTKILLWLFEKRL